MLMRCFKLQGNMVTKVARVQYFRVSIREEGEESETKFIVVRRGWREPRGCYKYARM
jgi:hypothetical protein